MLRVMILIQSSLFEYCFQLNGVGQQWGRGEWDYWEKEWDTLYPLKFTSKGNAETLKTCRKYIPLVSRLSLNTRFRVLDGKKLTELFDMSSLAPENLKRIVGTSDTGTLNLKGLRPCVQWQFSDSCGIKRNTARHLLIE